jgi:hypothetical protein
VLAAFSFGSPIVEYVRGGVARRCSLGTLLIIVDDLTAFDSDRRALLLSLRGQGDRTESDEQRLYATWPSSGSQTAPTTMDGETSPSKKVRQSDASPNSISRRKRRVALFCRPLEQDVRIRGQEQRYPGLPPS